jgi:hypothetical protein
VRQHDGVFVIIHATAFRTVVSWRALVKKDGRDLQRLIRVIEEVLSTGNKSVKIDMPKMLPDKVSGEMREHDVVLTITTGHHETLVALECRDRSRPVGVNAVEEFSKKCEATGIHSGVIVSAKGFYKTALIKAAFYNIGCFTLEEAKSFDWCLAAGMTIRRRMLTKIQNVTLVFPNDVRPERETFQDEDGRPITKEVILGWAQQVVKHYGAPKPPYRPTDIEPPSDYTRSARDTNPSVYGVINGERLRASLLALTVSYTVTEDFEPFSFRTYRDVGKSKDVSQAAVLTMKVSDGKFADVVLATDEEGRITVSMIGRAERPKLPKTAKKRRGWLGREPGRSPGHPSCH